MSRKKKKTAEVHRQSISSSKKKNNVEEIIIIPLLTRRSCHLPGNNWKEDWVQNMQNNHIVVGICLHHRLHPVEWWERILALIGSVSFGLAATNVTYLWDAYDQEEMDGSVVLQVDEVDFVLTKGMVVLWTLGCACHSLFDLLSWHIMSCVCCHPGGRWGSSRMAHRCKDCGSYMLIPVVLGLVGIAAFAVLTRASQQQRQQQQAENGGNDYYEDDDSSLLLWKDIKIESFAFLLKYCVELLLAWFVYYPIVGTILFSGILGCGGRLPVLGGRPRDLRLVEEEKFGGRSSSKQGQAYKRMST